MGSKPCGTPRGSEAVTVHLAVLKITDSSGVAEAGAGVRIGVAAVGVITVKVIGISKTWGLGYRAMTAGRGMQTPQFSVAAQRGM